MEMHAELVEECGDRDVPGFLEGGQLQLVEYQNVAALLHRQFPGPEQAGQENLGQAVRVLGREDQQRMARKRASDPDVYGEDECLGAAGDGHDLGGGTAA